MIGIMSQLRHSWILFALVGVLIFVGSGFCPETKDRYNRKSVVTEASIRKLMNTLRLNVDDDDSLWRRTIEDKLERQQYEKLGPLIGVLTQPVPKENANAGKEEYKKVHQDYINHPLFHHDDHHHHHGHEHQTISGPLVSWINSGGGRVVPIPYNAPWNQIERLFGDINGLVLPGGSGVLQPGHPFFDTAERLLNLAIQANKEGDVFPVFGICLGFETMHIIFANSTREELLKPSVGQESSSNIITPTLRAQNSLFFNRWSKQLLHEAQMKKFKPTFNAHIWAVPPSAYEEFPILKETLNILTTTKDEDGNEYVSTIEHKRYPIFGTQYHPEKVAFEFSDDTIPHTRTAIEIGFAIADLFVDVARLNDHKMEYKQEVKEVIDNYERRFLASEQDQESSDDPLPDTLWLIPEPEETRSDPEEPVHGRVADA